MNTDPVKIMIDEHRVILKVAAAWEMVDRAVEHGIPFPADLIAKILDFILVFADGYHHHREEELFVPFVENVSSERARTNVGLVRQEHQMARYRARRLHDLLPAAAEGDEASQVEVRRILGSYCSLISCHIGMEDMAFFPNGYAAMSTQARSKLQRAFVEFDAVPEHQEIDERYRKIAVEIIDEARALQGSLKHPV